MGLRLCCAVLVTFVVGCVQPSFTKCPEVDCPKDFVCDGQGGCALPAQLTQCSNKETGDLCSYVDMRSNTVEGGCSNGVCLPIGCGNFLVTPNETCDDGNTVNGDGCSADCQSNETCGNGSVDPATGEQCDDGNADAGDGCQPDCKNPRCGDSITDISLNEACDDGPANSLAPDATCRPSCAFPRCGDGVTDPSNGEICDDNNNNPNDGCAGDCKSDETCGNNVTDVLAGEVCDDGNILSNDGCRNDCKSTEACGNNVTDSARGEVCDDGNIVSGDGCSSDCRSLEVCGNSVLDTIDEQCDLGTSNSNAPDSMCRTTCKLPACGDDILDPMRNEQCDDGLMNANVADACRTSCQLPRCGDTIQDMMEACDDGNYLSGDGCSGDCRSAETCGNSYIDTATGEQCDAGSANSNLANAACRTTCKLPRCGDAAVDTSLGEACDAGAANSQSANAACRTNCQPRRCGDTIIDTASGEVCDDGNTTSGDNCSADCKSIESCGNGILDASKGEQCDAGVMNSNLANAPCRSDCTLPRCGDSAVDTTRGETCDAGASNSQAANAACRTNCQLRRCGDTIIDNLSLEVCDDGNAVANDGCSVDCKSMETCGNGIVDVSKGEQCDAGTMNSNLANAPCRTTCQFPSCGDGATDTTRGEACDAGAANSNLANAACRTNCQPKRCGDTIFDTATEVCDDGNIASGDNCSADCTSLETCPNGIVDTAKGEKCDDGNMVNNDFCHNNCTLPTCGDNIVDFNEQCDNGNANSNAPNAACRPTCLARRCGDGINDNMNGEVCDDGNLAFSDGCTPDCKSNESCGNAIVDITVGEQCDDGNGRGRDGCSACKGEDAVVLNTGITLPNMTTIQMVYDAHRKRVVMLNFGTTYEFDGVSWTQMKPRRSPGSRTAPGLAYDPIRKRVILFGGYYNNYMADTWEWDGNDWVDRQPANAPSPRYYTNMQFDPNRNKIVLYGGFTSGGALDETWEWDGTNWAKITTVGATPGQKCGHSMAFDAVRKEMVLYGGGCSGTAMWTFNGTTATWTSKGTQTIPTDYFQYFAYDPNRAAVVLWVRPQVTYEWNGSTWNSVSGTTPVNDLTFGNARNGAMVYDAARSQLVLTGGLSCPTMGGACVYPGTWTRTGTTWAQLPAFVQPPYRSRAAAAYDPTRGKMLLFGGNETCQYCGNAKNDTWEWDGRRWTQIAATTPPAIRAGQWADFNTSTRTVVMFGGNSYDSFTDTFTEYADLYSYSNGTWTAPPLSTGRAGVRNSAMAYNASNNSVVTFGGYDVSRVATNETWIWTAAGGWSMSGATAPPHRHNHVMGYDRIRQKVVMFGGVAASGNMLADTWEWNGSSWTAGNAGPLGRKGSALYYNPDMGKLNLFGNNSQGAGGEDLWEYGAVTGNATWTQRPVADAPGQNYRGATVYDAARHQAVIYGGHSFSNQTRFLRYRSFVTPEACTFANVDYDKDGLAGCADSDCWSVCTPMCPPGSAASCATSTNPRCGNGTCDPLEDCDICPSDCTAGCPAQQCGDFRCNGTETRTTCPSDCP